MILLQNIWLTQRRVDLVKVARLLRELSEAKSFHTRLLIREADDGETELIDGHHRATALWLAGRCSLTFGEYTLVSSKHSQCRMMKLGDMKYEKHSV